MLKELKEDMEKVYKIRYDQNRHINKKRTRKKSSRAESFKNQNEKMH